jgi:hypothetical protein
MREAKPLRCGFDISFVYDYNDGREWALTPAYYAHTQRYYVHRLSIQAKTSACKSVPSASQNLNTAPYPRIHNVQLMIHRPKDSVASKRSDVHCIMHARHTSFPLCLPFTLLPSALNLTFLCKSLLPSPPALFLSSFVHRAIKPLASVRREPFDT